MEKNENVNRCLSLSLESRDAGTIQRLFLSAKYELEPSSHHITFNPQRPSR